MNYEIVSLKAMNIAGLQERTNNAAPDMFQKIGGLWQKLYSPEVMASVPGRKGENAYGLYTNYESGATGDYDVLAGFPVESIENLPGGLSAAVIPAGRYAKFSLVADMTAGGIGEAWNDIWASGLDRAFTTDFEEYLPSENMSEAPVNIYIALKE